MSLLRKGLDFSTALCNIKLWGQKLGRPCPVPKLSDLVILPLRKWYFPSLYQAIQVEQVSSQPEGKESLVLTLTCPSGLQSGMICQPEGK